MSIIPQAHLKASIISTALLKDKTDVVQMTQLTPHSNRQGQSSAGPSLKATDPQDFSEGGSEHRKGVIASTSLIVVLISAVKLEPQLLGVSVSVPVLWMLIGVSHIYFFAMWRITAPIDSDSEKYFWNFRGLVKQALLGGAKNFPSKTKAQLFFIRSLPIWAFIIGFFGVLLGLFRYFFI